MLDSRLELPGVAPTGVADFIYRAPNHSHSKPFVEVAYRNGSRLDPDVLALHGVRKARPERVNPEEMGPAPIAIIGDEVYELDDGSDLELGPETIQDIADLLSDTALHAA